MTFISNIELTAPTNDKASARLTSTTGRWSGRKAFEILPGVFLTSIVAGTAFAIRVLPGMANFSPMILSMVIGIAFHNTVGTAAWATPSLSKPQNPCCITRIRCGACSTKPLRMSVGYATCFLLNPNDLSDLPA